ncbi:MAG: DUF6452 family protein [Bacteroidota bacterium]
MKRFRYPIITFFILTIIVWSCERDDICAEATQTTPALFIEFRDISNPDDLKSVRELRVIAIDEDDNPIDTLALESASPNAISLPLLVAPELDENGEVNIITIRYILEKNSDLADNDNDTNDSTIDILELTYSNEFVYVSRACGFKSIFRLEPVIGARKIEDDNDDWIINVSIENELIENEDEAKVLILH